MSEPELRQMSGWFAGPKAENGEWFADMIRRIVQDYHAWRRNYFPEDGVVLDSGVRRHSEEFRDAFEDRLLELLGRLKADCPFHSPRYAAHMLSEQTLPSIAGYFAAMLYNPNNVSSESAPVTVRLELEAARMISRMLGHGERSWSHLTSGGTVANIEALWVARTTLFLPLIVSDMRKALGLAPDAGISAGLRTSPGESLDAFARVFRESKSPSEAIRAYLDSPHNVVERGLAATARLAGADPALIVPQTHHYCFEKALDVLGIGRRGVVSVEVDEHFRMCPEALDRALDGLTREGRCPLAVVAVVGSTEEGAVDPVDRILDVRSARAAAGQGSFWLHADGAYGGYLRTMTVPERMGLGEPFTTVRIDGFERRLGLMLPEQGACAALERLGECDSITIDPHKLGYVPYPAGAVSFRSDLVKPITRQEAPYLGEGAGDVETERRSEAVGLYVLEGSKPGAAAAAVWLSHTLIPLDTTGHGALIRETVRCASELHALLTRMPELSPRACSVRCEALGPPGSNIVCYAFRPKGEASLAAINRLNRAVYECFSIGEAGRVYNQRYFVSRTTLRASQYPARTVRPFLERLGATPEEYGREGVFLLRSVLMSPWCGIAKSRGRHYLSELASELYNTAERLACSPVQAAGSAA
ncbi:MAG: pyridoxal phosphate-dependent decarboxylase family protein [Phycisphaerales bacterium]